MRTTMPRVLLSLALLMPPLLAHAQQPAQAQRPSGPPWIGLVANARVEGQGLVISRVLKASPAQRAGLKAGDILMELGGHPLSSARDFKIALRQRVPGDKLDLQYIRAGKQQRLSLELAASPSQLDLATTQLMGEQAPGMELLVVKGQGVQPTNLDKLRGKPVVIEFWATWCQACQQLSPTLNGLHDRLGDRVHFLAISGESPELLRKDMLATSKRYPVAQDPDELGHDDFFVKSYPLIYILDKEHRVRKILTGYSAPKELEAAVNAVAAQ